jgi:hypothetical protein
MTYYDLWSIQKNEDLIFNKCAFSDGTTKIIFLGLPSFKEYRHQVLSQLNELI